MRCASALLLAWLPLAWLVPNHYPPWNSAWSEGFALAILCAAALLAPRDGALPRPAAFALLIAAASVALQAFTGRIYFAGDAFMVALYLAALALAISLGAALQRGRASHGPEPLALLATGLVAAGLISVGIALSQWLGVGGGLLVIELPPGQRPFANLAQPNHFGTASFLALVAAALLRQRRLIGATGFWVVALWLCFGMVMSGSRTGWLQMAGLVLAVWLATPKLPLALSRGGSLALSRGGSLALALCFGAGVWVWPRLSEWLGLYAGRALAESAEAGTRWRQWTALADAVSRQPLGGYGWTQTSVAQLEVAAEYPPVHENLEHAHNIVLDLLIWAGLPVGVLITLAIGWWFFSRVRACNDASAWWWLIGLAGLGLHGLLEYPLEYAFFLIPAGIAVGAIEHHHPHATALAVRQLTLRGAAVALSAAVALLGWDYLRAEQAFRILRLESAGIGSQGLKTPPPDLLVLTQLEAFQRFAHTEARVGLRADELLWMQRVASRYAYPPAMLRQALAEGLNGQEEKAALTLQRLCRIHLKERCAEARTSWAQLQRRYPRLAAIPAP